MRVEGITEEKYCLYRFRENYAKETDV